jgi:hypothetical protein
VLTSTLACQVSLLPAPRPNPVIDCMMQQGPDCRRMQD